MEDNEIKIVEEKTTLKERFKTLDPKQLIVPVIIVIVFIGAIVGIVNYRQKARREQAPKLEVTGIQDGQIYNESQIVLEGNTYPGDKVTVNGKETTVDSKGKFKVEVPLKEGLNEVAIVAESKIGKKTETKKIVTRAYEQKVATTPTTGSKPIVSGDQNLNSSGPETFWIPETLSISGVLAAWQMSRKKLNKALRKSN